MAGLNFKDTFGKHIGKTKYQNVYEYSKNGKTFYRFKIHRVVKGKTITSTSIPYSTSRECAIAVDKWLISKGEEPVNILKKK